MKIRAFNPQHKHSTNSLIFNKIAINIRELLLHAECKKNKSTTIILSYQTHPVEYKHLSRQTIGR